MQDINDINVAATEKVTLKEIVNKLLNIKPSDKKGCPKGALVVKEFGGYKTTRMHFCNEQNPPCNYFKRTKDTPTPIYMGAEKKRYMLCPNH
jgi:hypothetical protein